jgi:hypothetical protein
MPRAERGWTHPALYLRDDSADVQRLPEGHFSATSNYGNCVLFDGSGMHRGGMVNKGERRCPSCWRKSEAIAFASCGSDLIRSEALKKRDGIRFDSLHF